MRCRTFRRHAHLLRDAPAGPRAAAVRAHLAECVACAQRHRALELGVAVLRRDEPAPSERMLTALDATLARLGAPPRH